MKITAIMKKMEKHYICLLSFVFFLAVLLRLTGANWGMPHDNLHPDEGIIFGQAYECALNHNFEVHTYYRPNHVTIKLNTLLYLGIQELYFEPQGKHDFALNYSENFSLFTTASRILTALFGVGTVVLAYLIALFRDKKCALLSALLFAVFPSFLEHSHYITPDIPLLFFMMAVLWAALNYQSKPSKAWLFWMAFFTALATCEKYPGAYGCVIIAAAVISVHGKKIVGILRDGLLSILFFVLGIMAVSPILLVDFRTVLVTMAGQNKQYHIGADGLNFGQTLFYYAKTMGVHLGLILTVCSVYGMFRAFRRNGKQAVLLAVLWAYILPISKLSIHWERYTLPIYAIGILFGASGILDLAQDAHAILKNRYLKGIVPVLLLGLPICSMLAGAAAVTGSFLAPDSRILLQDVFAGIDVTTDNTSYDCNTPLDPGGFYGAFASFEEGDPDRYKYGGGPRFIMTSSAQRDLYLAADPEVYGWIAEFYRRLDERYPLVYLFTVEVPQSHFLEVQNIWFSAKTVHRYMRGAAAGYEIRLYQRLP